MAEEAYSSEDLKFFEKILLEKLEKANHELQVLEKVLSRQEAGLESAGKPFEENAEVIETENVGQLAERQQKFIKQIELAIQRIKNGTYGICVVTGKVIDRERLKVVPHTMYAVDAKLNTKK
ncbi:TraR/DksA family transcriptional regulator [Cardinium endosymbiont of Oedothorax gibbosus]|uniref:TraR/DksA family transcriptional regulator n=1 Tax=Cardinium endosymbiont of Oedothorax gibbosus TaxID=931101 RepID=UPI00202558F4|nr:TraR/DksA family transcriptional regulator [Cardinium endosymbiont of Oedothorax gibbosus]CAH2559614.1 RNA polymerase-binding transcription factor DksA [Cardinium endosymbiont of Oedothorax gibbosus]